MQFDILTIFPNIFDSYINESILKIAQEKNKIQINTHDIRDFTKDKHKKVDDTPYGGGPGMVLMVQPIYDCLKSIKRSDNSRVIMLDPGGKEFNHSIASEYKNNYDQIILLCGRYEGFDERIYQLVDERISIGKYVLSGGELPALVVLESITRLLPGVLGNDQTINEESYTGDLDYVEYPQYTKPSNFTTDDGTTLNVPDVLLSGNHAEIEKWRKANSKS